MGISFLSSDYTWLSLAIQKAYYLWVMKQGIVRIRWKRGCYIMYEWEKLDHVLLACPKGGEQQAREFYQGILEMEELEKPEPLKERGGVWFQLGEVQLHIGVEVSFSPAKKAHPAIRIKNIHLLMKMLDEKNVAYQLDADLPGASRFYIHDPFGNRLEFLEWL